MLWKPDAIVDVEFVPTASGGRRGPTPNDQFGCPLGFEGEFFDCRLDLSAVGALYPGTGARVPLKFLFPGLILPRLKVGTQFELWEGKIIAHGTVAVLPKLDPDQRRAHREQLRNEFRPLYDRVLAILFEEDPAGINFEDNSDEYEPETDTIVPRLRGCRNVSDVQRLVHLEFVRWFDEEAMIALRPSSNELIEVNAVTVVGRVALDDVRPPCAQLRSWSESESRFEVVLSFAADVGVDVRSDRTDQRRRSCLRLMSVPNHCLEATHDLRCAPQAGRWASA